MSWQVVVLTSSIIWAIVVIVFIAAIISLNEKKNK